MIIKKTQPRANNSIFYAKNKSVPVTINPKNSGKHRQNLLTQINRQVNSHDTKKSPSPVSIKNNNSMFVQRVNDAFL